ncbi:3 beta-hydroxysteroid dehydrogenase/Delta 5--_4-isomerase [Thalassoglobus neptunius]|uniref:3 beta-hydroxysteroid dehydrogenase/Delta 5-->4-isomerase n=1 Tax=Thalassoglobus neptunius TaxID=1938619 RepID=A0A5C5X4F6_9PLAN|nr:NAD-dependent epimerase/dehydratase family protein [Thalassoglobus neptunius]TWT57608.1 3 beta-hydroxysteroid dehydrogenase/Delta 5-->4-isomerase [Thalassoglobus neptunius]
MKALVTGGAGFLGRHLVDQLLDSDNDVRILTRGDYPELADRVGIVRGDVRDKEIVQSACAGVDVVFHVAAVPGIWGPWKTFHGINTQGTLNIIEACQLHGVPKLVYTSSPSVVFDGKSHVNADESLPYPSKYLCHYPHSKALAEAAVLEANSDSLATVSLRPHLIWGPRDNHLIPRLIRRAIAGRLVRVGDGTNLVSCAYVENVAAAHRQACDELSPGTRVAGKAYFINEPDPVNLWEWVDQLLDLGGLPPVKRSISARLASSVGTGFEAVYRVLGKKAEPPMTRFLAAQLSQSHTYSIENARRDFGYQPLVTFEEGMARLAPEIKAIADQES